jgi:hypothetical protein
MDDTGAALAGVAADMGAGQVEIVAQEMHEQRTVLDIDRDGSAVHCEFDGRHALTPPEMIFELVRLETGGGNFATGNLVAASREWAAARSVSSVGSRRSAAVIQLSFSGSASIQIYQPLSILP